MARSVLFVCTYWGVRSSIARLFADSLTVPDVEFFSSGFESGKIGPMPINIMKKRGFELSAESPATVFELAKVKQDFDYVVALCSQDTQENSPILLLTLQKLFAGKSCQHINWNVLDFMSIQEQGDARVQAGENIVSDIETQVRQFVSNVL